MMNGENVGEDDMTDARVKHRANTLLDEAEIAVSNGELTEARDYIMAARTLIDGLEHKLQQQRNLKPPRSRRKLKRRTTTLED